MTKKDLSAYLECFENREYEIIKIKFNEKAFEIKLKIFMTIDETSTFIDRVVNGCFDSDDDYRPEYIEPIFHVTLLQMFTNVPVFTKKMESLENNAKIVVVDIEKSYQLALNLKLWEKDCGSFRTLYSTLWDLVNEKLKFQKQRVLSGERKTLEKTKEDLENGIALINSIGNKLNETMIETIKNTNITKAVDEFSDRVENMTDKQLINFILSK